ncbi:MAG: NAD-dependent epimerase/dehydratase family protein [Chloroflexi bacterium]|nr:NAD-dependent epimerase/dehydratase family protein [Chloroflexota bacterium]
MNVLVTGGAGFIGSHIVETLGRAGHTVGVLDDLSSGNPAHLPPGVPLHRVSICAVDQLAPVFARQRWDAVVHCAAQIKVNRSMENPAFDREVNVVGTANLLDLCRRHAVPRLVFLSTGGAIYGETPTPASEETLPAPKSYYAIHKWTAERYVELSGLTAVCLRLANVYGPRQRSDLEGGVIAIFAERLWRGEPIEIHGTGEQVRDFVYVKDVATAVADCLAHDERGIYNVGTGRPTTINEALAALVASTGREPVLVRHTPSRIGDIFRSLLDARKLMGRGFWQPRWTLADGLAELGDGATGRRGG